MCGKDPNIYSEYFLFRCMGRELNIAMTESWKEGLDGESCGDVLGELSAWGEEGSITILETWL